MELRPGGGFIGSYAVFSIKTQRFRILKFRMFTQLTVQLKFTLNHPLRLGVIFLSPFIILGIATLIRILLRVLFRLPQCIRWKQKNKLMGNWN